MNLPHIIVGQGATQETVLSCPGPGLDRANPDQKVMNQKVRQLRQLCSGLLLEVERNPWLVTEKWRLDGSRGEANEEFIRQTLMKGYNKVYIGAHNRLREQQRTSPDEQKEVIPKPSKKKKKGRWSRKKDQ